MSCLIPFKSQVHLDEGTMLFRRWRQSITEGSTFAHGMREVKVHGQIIYGSIGHLMKLSEVRQALTESTLVLSCHENNETKVKEV